MAMTDEERREKERVRLRRWRAANPEAARDAKARWRARNPEQARDVDRRWRTANPEPKREKVQRSRRWRVNNPSKYLLCRCIASAKIRGQECTITVEYIEALLAPMVCSATGLPLSLEHGGDSARNPWAPSVDRLDNSKGYVPGNVRVVCWAFNMMRCDFPDEVVFALARAVAARAP
jgi:hypothetical protein